MGKGKREILTIDDFRGGQVTKGSELNLDTKSSPDCLNVYSEGPLLRRRLGYGKLNPTASIAGSTGNGIYNLVRSASEQLFLSVSGSKLYKMDLDGSAWDGTFDAVSADTGGGTSFSDSIVHFNTFNGVLLFTTEARDKPQKMLATDTSHFNIDNGGSGTAPQAKYIQVWKNHVWLMNLGAGGTLTEDCDSISDWTDNDTAPGASTQTTFSGEETFRFLGGASNGNDAKRTIDVGTITDNFTVDMRMYFDTLGTIANGDYSEMNIKNGVIDFKVRWSDDGLDVYDGAAWVEVGVDLAAEGVWSRWKFVVTGGTAATAHVDIYKDSNPVGLHFLCADAQASNDGQIDLFAKAGGNVQANWYLDHIYVDSSVSKTEYITNFDFANFTGADPDNFDVFPTQPETQFKLNDNASDAVIVNTGSSANAGSMQDVSGNINTSLVTTTGLINTGIHFTAASEHHVFLPSATVNLMTPDTVGTICMWIYPDVVGGTLLSLGDNNANSYFRINFADSGGAFSVRVFDPSNDMNVTCETGITSAGWHHLAITQNATTVQVYVNASSVAMTLSAGQASHWFAAVATGTIDIASIGKLEKDGGSESFFTGRIDDFRYYTTVISTAEINALYAEGVGTESHAITSVDTTAATVQIGTNSLQVDSSGQYQLITQTLASSSSIAATKSIMGAWFQGTNNMTYKFRVNDGTSDYDSAVFTANGTWQWQYLKFTTVSGATAIASQLITTSAGTFNVDQWSIRTEDNTTTNDNSDRIQRSAINTISDWDGTASGNNDIVTAGDIGLQGSVVLSDRQFVFKKYSIHKLTYTASTPLLDIKQTASRIGTASPRSIKIIELPSIGEVAVFLGTDRVLYMFDGADITPLSDTISVSNGISSIYLNNINAQALDKVHAVVHDDLKWYELFIPIGSATTPDFSIVMDFSTSPLSFWPFDNRNFSASTISDIGNGQRAVYAQEGTTGFVMRTNSTNSDDGDSITARWTVGKQGDPTILRRIDEFVVSMESVNATPVFEWRMDYETDYISKTMSSGKNEQVYNPGRIDNLLQLRLRDDSTNNPFKIRSVVGLSKDLEHGKTTPS